MTLKWLYCFSCKEPFVLHPDTEATLRRSAQTFHCPWGHPQHFPLGDSAETKLRRERDRLVQRLAEKDDDIRRERQQRDHAERRASAFKGQVTKLRNRAAAGICPCCNRHFANLQRHMSTKHADFKGAPNEPAPGPERD